MEIHALKNRDRPDTPLSGLRILAMLPPHTEARADYLARLLIAGKQCWGWHIDLFGSSSDRNAFQEVLAPSGRLFTSLDPFKPTVWENDPERVAAIDRRLSAAEVATRVPVGQLVLASQATIGCAFVAPVHDVTLTASTARVLNDNREPFRVIRRLFQNADEMVETSAPDLVLAYEWEKPWRSTVWMAATGRGIPCAAIRRSKLNPDHYFWTTDRTLFNTAAREVAIAKRQAQAPVSDAAFDYIKKFREAPEPVKYVEAKWQLESKKGWFVWHVNFMRNAARYLLRNVMGRGKRRKWLLRKLFAYNFRIFLFRNQQRYFRAFDEEQLRTIRYIYFPMHKETDLPLVFQSPRWHDQRNTVQLLAAVLPSGYQLFVREQRYNVGHRSSRYYRDMLRLPNVTLLEPFGSQFKYIHNAELIVTENGTSGWEGLLLRRRVLTLSRSNYDGAELAGKVDDPDQIGASILKLLSDSAGPDPTTYDLHLGWMIDAERATTFPMAETGIPSGLDQLAERVGGMLRSAVRS